MLFIKSSVILCGLEACLLVWCAYLPVRNVRSTAITMGAIAFESMNKSTVHINKAKYGILYN